MVDDPGAIPAGAFALLLGADGLRLRAPADLPGRPLRIDPASGPLSHRLRSASRNQPLAKALGLGSGSSLRRVIDGTAGLGRDALYAAALGAEVAAIERDPALWALLQDTLQRMQQTGDSGAAGHARRVTLCLGDLEQHLSDLLNSADTPTAIYLDPMYPAVEKAAQPPKEMQFLRRLLGPGGDDAERLLRTAIEARPARVVMKRPPSAAALWAPDAVVRGKLARYDIYLPASR
jgi:16S rRNA (guanine1516-N2)-methyltransferase